MAKKSNEVLEKEITSSRIFLIEQHESTEKYGQDDDGMEDDGGDGCNDTMSLRKEPKQTKSSIHKITHPSITKIDLSSHEPPDQKKQVHLRDEHYNLIPDLLICHLVFVLVSELFW